jgi:pimeloyl-ACP methyl ester carboxylesterase
MQGARGSAVATYVVGAPERGEVVVLPGLCVSRYLRPACAALADIGFRAWLVEPPDWPGAGAAEPGPHRLSDLAGPVETLLQGHALEDVVLVGQSVGAQVAAHVARRRPALVGQLVLQGPVFDPSCRSVRRALSGAAIDVRRERPSLLASEIPEWLRVGPRRIRQVLGMALADRLEDTLAGASVPTSVVVGEHDPLCGVAWARSLAGPDRLTVMEGLPHSAAHRDPRGFAALVGSLVDVSSQPAPRRPR